MKTMNFNYTEKEAFELIKEYHPDNYNECLQPSIKNIIGLSKIKGYNLKKSFQENNKMVSSHSSQLYLLAAYHLLKEKFDLIREEIDLIESYKNHTKLQYDIIRNEKGSDEYKRLRHIAVSDKIKELEDEKAILIGSLAIDPYTESTL